jgi:hypothetical protein
MDLLSGQVLARMDKRERNKLAKAAQATDEYSYMSSPSPPIGNGAA